MLDLGEIRESRGRGINECPLSLAKYGRGAALQKYQCQEELYRLPSPPLLSALALMQYAIYSANLNFCYLKLEKEEIKVALTSSQKPLILLRPRPSLGV